MKYLFFLLMLIFASCSNSAVQEELSKVQGELEEATTKIAELSAEIEPEGELVHLVFFKIKPDADQAALIAEIKKLEAIEEVMDLEFGPFEDLGDARALNYSMVMQMSFTDTLAYQNYQKHPIHLALRENTKQFMAGPPATYDFVKK